MSRSSKILWRSAFLMFLLVTFLIPFSSGAANTITQVLFPSEMFIRNTGSPDTLQRTFSVPSTVGNFTLHVINGNGAGDNAISSAVIQVNGSTILKGSDLNQNVKRVDKPLTNLVHGTNTLSVQVKSIPSHYITVSITGDYLLNLTITDPQPGSNLPIRPTTVQGNYSSYTNAFTIMVNNVVASAPSGTFRALYVPLTPGINVLHAVITTADGLSTQDNIVINGNLPPVAVAGLPQAVRVNDNVYLDGRSSYDPEGALITYRWSFISNPAGSHVALTFPTSVSPFFSPEQPGDYTAQLIVNDGGQDSTPDNVIVIALPNSPPTAVAGTPQNVNTGEWVSLDGTQSFSPDGYPLNFSWLFSSKPQGSLVGLDNSISPRPNFLPDMDGAYVLSLVVNDGRLYSIPNNVTITSFTPNAPPVANAGSDQVVPQGSIISLDGTVSYDPEHQPITYFWSIVSMPAGSTSALDNEFSPTPKLPADKAGDFVIRLVVNDGNSNSASDTVIATSVDSPPVAIATTTDTNVWTGTPISLDGTGSYDPNGDPIAYRWSLMSSPAGSAAAVGDSSSAFATFIPDIEGTYVIQLVVNDGTYDSVPATVAITASVSPGGITVPELGYLDKAAAEALITSSHLVVGKETYAPAYDIPMGVVMAQYPYPGYVVPQGTPIDLVFSRATARVPYVVGLTKTQADNVISSAQFVVGNVTEVVNPTVPAGIVLKQNPSSANRIVEGSTIDLVVSSGPAVQPPLPDPTTIAPAVDPTASTDVASSTAFLYTGPNSIQIGVNPGTIDTRRAAVVRGRVKGLDGTPLSGVTVSVLNHPEYGYTLSRADGMFDLAINGGGVLSISFMKAGFPEVQRQANIPWQDFAWTSDVVMTPYDEKVTTVDLSSETIQVARGNAVTDGNGTRTGTMLFMPGTQAELVFPDSYSRPINSLGVRVTEFTVGPNGPKAMPADLPPTSAYTYCVEFSADEAVAEGASGVRFNQPIPYYIENFLKFPIGLAVPTGYFDHQGGIWIPSTDGRIIKILSATSGMADIDINGDGNAESGADLASMGITDIERQQLAVLYTPGTGLWRIQIPHFSTFDFNHPPGPPVGAAPPNQPLPINQYSPLDNPDCADGSIIECENQILGESIPLTGIPFGLNYRSDRVPGRADAFKLSIPVSGDSTPSGLLRIILEVTVGGQKIERSFSNAPKQSYEFHWDGKDAYGRKMQGKQPVKVRIGYVYQGVYYGIPAQNQMSFGQLGIMPINEIRTGLEANLWQEWEGALGNSSYSLGEKKLGAGAWTLDIHHTYDPEGHTLYFGDGGRRQASDQTRIITRFANAPGLPHGLAFRADGNIYVPGEYRLLEVTPDGSPFTIWNGNNADEIPDITATPDEGAYFLVSNPWGILWSGDGLAWVIFQPHTALLHYTSNGYVEQVAGSIDGYGGDGGPVGSALFHQPQGLAYSPDGSYYIADTGNNRIRRVGLDGIVTTYAGNGTPGFSGDGGNARNASLNYPSKIALGRDGSLFISDTRNNRVRRVTPDGIITTVAGSGQIMNGGDGGPATQASLLAPLGIALGPDGTLYIVESGYQRVRRVTPDGIITTIAGGGNPGASGDVGDGGPATQAYLNNPVGIAVGPDRNIYIGGAQYGSYVRRVEPAFPGRSLSEIAISSETGRELYSFSTSGKHLRTVDTLTGAILYQFGYDGDGLLTQVLDGDGNLTSIERDSSGNPTAIVAPGGQRTTTKVDSNGYLSEVSDPAGNTHKLVTTPDGLLTSFTEPAGGQHNFRYDTDGRLTHDEDPEGGFKDLIPPSSMDGVTSSMGIVTALGRYKAFTIVRSPNGDTTRTITSPAGAQTTIQKNADGTGAVRNPDGTVIETTDGPDPRFWMDSPIQKKIVISTPAGLVATITKDRSISSDPNAGLTSQIDTTVVNGRTYTQYFDVAQSQFTNTSPENRLLDYGIDNQGRITTVTADPTITPAMFSYDGKGRLAQAAQGEVQSTFVYDNGNRLTSITDAQNHSVGYSYDAADRVSSVKLPSGRTYGFGYDATGNRTSITMPDNSVHLLGYTKVNLDNSYTPPGNPSYAMKYNLDHDWVRTLLPSGRSIDSGYDTGGRVDNVVYTEASVAFSYADNTDRVYAISRTSTPENAVQELSFDYDGSLLTKIAFSGAANGEYRYVYDNNFQVASFALDNAVGISLNRDADGLITQYGPYSITRSGPAGAPSNLTDSSALNIDYGYDSHGRLESRTHTVAGTQVYQVTLGYDNVGRINHKTEVVAGASRGFDYGYDVDGQLTDVFKDGSVVEHCSFDNNGNRTSTQIASATYDGQDRLIQQGGVAYAFDDDGYLARRGSDTFQYSSRGELLSATVGGQIVSYVYDGMGRRVARTSGAGTVQYLYGNPGNPFQVTATRAAADNALTNNYYDVSGNLIAIERNGQRYYIATDHLGTPKIVTDSSGNVVRQAEYNAWGAQLSDSNPSFPLSVGYAGGIEENSMGLVRFGFRDYEPGTGRWFAKDPILFEGGVNLYQYVQNNPINRVDPDGLKYAQSWGVVGAIAGGSIVAGGSLVADAVTGGLNILATTAEIGTGITLGGAVGYALGSIADLATGNVSYFKGERNRDSGKGQDEFYDPEKHTREDLQKIERDRNSTPKEKERAKRARKHRDAKCK